MHILNTKDAITGCVFMQEQDVPAPMVVCAKAGEAGKVEASMQVKSVLYVLHWQQMGAVLAYLG